MSELNECDKKLFGIIREVSEFGKTYQEVVKYY